MLDFDLNEGEGVLTVIPRAALSEQDFKTLDVAVDAYLEHREKLAGLLLLIDHFPGWEDFPSFLKHIRFVHSHHEQIERVAMVADETFLLFLPSIASHFVQADIRHFPRDQEAAARQWITE
jgi:hypothetical protein